MKRIAVVIDAPTNLEDFIRKNLELVFDQLVKINFYYLNALEADGVTEESVVLVMTEERGIQIQRYLGDNKAIIVIRRTVKEESLYPIFKIPENTKVLVVNDTEETTKETVSLLYHIGIDHLKLIPFEAGRDYEGINIAITPNVARKVPAYIDNIIDIGNRYIDITSFIQIIDKLKISDKKVTQNLITYSESIITFDSGVKGQVKELYVKNEQLDAVINLSKEGIVLTDVNERIMVSNNTFSDIFETKDDLIGTMMTDLFSQEVCSLLEKETLNEELIEFNNKFIIINKTKTQYLGENYGFYYNFQEVTYIKTLEQNLRKKLKSRGFITRYTFEAIKTDSKAMLECVKLSKRIAKSELTVIIQGESGTGKEMIAQSIHNESQRSTQPFIALNCAAFAENLLESELFGYEGGAFTGALKEGKAGVFELADHGTIFLDEIGDMPLSLQSRLLRVLQEKQVMRIGSQRVIEINTRVIAATNRDLKELVKEGMFREDLYFRINVLPIHVPPLRRRREDIISLLEHFGGKHHPIELSEAVKRFILEYAWPGNIRELENVAAYFGLVETGKIEIDNLPYYLIESSPEFSQEFESIRESMDSIYGYEILNALRIRNTYDQGVGRQKLQEYLQKCSVQLSEGEIRGLLSTLNKYQLIKSYKGRKGSVLTRKGLEFLEWADK